MSTYVKILCVILVAAIGWSAINPLSGANWWLEMMPVIIALPVITYLGTKFKISDLSYTLMIIYVLMLIAQAHYGVGFVPLGKVLAPWFHTRRNIFDRMTHFCSGLLWFYPLYEMVKQGLGKRDLLDFMIPATLIMGLGAVYEVAEFLTFEIASKRLSFLFIGAQGDAYDSSKDLTMALFGTILGGFFVFLSQKYFRNRSKHGAKKN